MSSQKFHASSPKKPRRRIITIDLLESSSDEQVVNNSYPRPKSKGPRELAKAAAAIPNLIQKMPSQRNETERHESPGRHTFKNLACPAPTLPAFLPQIDPHKNWNYSRVFSQEIYEVMEKHLKKFDGTYLSRSLLGEVFFERINDSDAEFDQSIFFEAVLVEEVGPLFKYGQRGQRIRLKCTEASTFNNAATSSKEKERIVVALDSLAELLSFVVKPGDYLVLFGDILIEKERVICINSRQRHPVCIAHYRHNGVFNGCIREGPISLKKSLNSIQKYCQCIHELGPNESRYEVEPATSKELGTSCKICLKIPQVVINFLDFLVLQPDSSLDEQIHQGHRSNGIQNSPKNHNSKRPSSSGLTGSKAAEMVRSCSRSPPPRSARCTSPLNLNGTLDRSPSKSKASPAKPRRVLSPQKLIEQVRRSKVPSTAPISNLRVSSPNSKASSNNVKSKSSQMSSKRSQPTSLNSKRSQRTSQSGGNRSPTSESFGSQLSRRESSPEMFLNSSEDEEIQSKSKTSDSESRLSLDIAKEIDAGVLNDSPQNAPEPAAKRSRQQTIFKLRDCYISLNPIPGFSPSKTSSNTSSKTSSKTPSKKEKKRSK